MSMTELASSTKAGATIAAGTGMMGQILDLIPNDITKLATLVGICLSLVLIYVQYRNVQKTNLEIEIMRRKEAERLEASLRQREEGQTSEGVR